jgi:hypothetical protein
VIRWAGADLARPAPDAQALKRIIAAMAQDAVAAQAEIAKLRFQLARYRRAEFGRSSEKLVSNGEQSGPRIGMQKGPLSGVGLGLSR